MIKVENIETYGFRTAIRAMRNPHDSWDKSDSGYIASGAHYENVDYVVGEKDLELMRKLVRAGAEHRTFMRMIMVSMDITAPLLWWKEMDRYTVGKSQVSCSTMHKIAAKEFELDDFSHEHLRYEYSDGDGSYDVATWAETSLFDTIEILNRARDLYLKSRDKKHWWLMIQLLPSSYNQKRTICMSYETVFKIMKERTGHKLDEWRDLCEILRGLPYVKELTE